MESVNFIQRFSNLPLSHQTLVSYFKNYKNPNAKIHRLIEQRVLVPLRRGLYIIEPALSERQPSLFLIANHLYGPSYVSLDYALQYYGAIPEKVYTITSVTPKRTKEFINDYGRFSYTHIPLKYYSAGFKQLPLENRLFAMIASPEKALTDKIITNTGILLHSKKEAETFLLDDLRISEEWLKALDREFINSWLNFSPKKNSLKQLIKFLETL